MTASVPDASQESADPLLLAGQVVQLGPTYGRYAGRWLVTAARHRFNAGGYTTTISIKVI